MPATQRVAEASVRIDMPAGGSPSVSVLAYRAFASGATGADVLGLVDPLVAAAPEQGCELRDMLNASRAMRSQGGSLELEEIGTISLEATGKEAVGSGNPVSINLAPRVLPDYGSGVSGAISEGGPVEFAWVPRVLALIARGGGRVEYALPTEGPRLLSADGTSIGNRVASGAGDLTLALTGPAGSFFEARPFGSTMTVACAASGQADGSRRVVISADLVGRLVGASSRVPVSFDAVWRESRLTEFVGRPLKLSVEMRTSIAVELRP